MLLGALPPDAVGGIVPWHSQSVVQLHTLYVDCGGLRGAHRCCQGGYYTGYLVLLLLLPQRACSAQGFTDELTLCRTDVRTN